MALRHRESGAILIVPHTEDGGPPLRIGRGISLAGGAVNIRDYRCSASQVTVEATGEQSLVVRCFSTLRPTIVHRKGGANQSLARDEVAKLEPGDFFLLFGEGSDVFDVIEWQRSEVRRKPAAKSVQPAFDENNNSSNNDNHNGNGNNTINTSPNIASEPGRGLGANVNSSQTTAPGANEGSLIVKISKKAISTASQGDNDAFVVSSDDSVEDGDEDYHDFEDDDDDVYDEDEGGEYGIDRRGWQKKNDRGASSGRSEGQDIAKFMQQYKFSGQQNEERNRSLDSAVPRSHAQTTSGTSRPASTAFTPPRAAKPEPAYSESKPSVAAATVVAVSPSDGVSPLPVRFGRGRGGGAGGSAGSRQKHKRLVLDDDDEDYEEEFSDEEDAFEEEDEEELERDYEEEVSELEDPGGVPAGRRRDQLQPGREAFRLEHDGEDVGGGRSGDTQWVQRLPRSEGSQVRAAQNDMDHDVDHKAYEGVLDEDEDEEDEDDVIAGRARKTNRLRRGRERLSSNSELPSPNTQPRKKLKKKIQVKKLQSLDDDEEEEEEFDEELMEQLEEQEEEEEEEAAAREFNEDDRNEEEVVGDMLQECEMIGAKLRSVLSSWTSGNTDAEGRVNITQLKQDDTGGMETSSESLSGGDSSLSRGSPLIAQADIPGLDLSLVLKPYQVVAVNWLRLLYLQGVNGVLADDMGLGKTVQTISFLTYLQSLEEKERRRIGPHLIVVPASVMSNWEREVKKFAPCLRVVVYHGSQRERTEMQEDLAFLQRNGKNKNGAPFVRSGATEEELIDVIITTYSYFERDSNSADRAFLRSFRFGYLVLDEGHSIKNAKSSRFKRLVAVRAKYRLLLSGTPVQNRLQELLSILHFLMPSVFDRDSEAIAEWFEEAEQVGKEEELSKIRSLLAPFVLRRVKAEVLDQLSAKKTQIVCVDLLQRQREIYDDILKKEAARRKKVTEQANVVDLSGAGQENGANESREGGAGTIASRRTRRRRRTALERELDSLTDTMSHGGGGRANNKKKKDNEDNITPTKHLFTELRKAANHALLLRRIFVKEEDLQLLSNVLHQAGAYGSYCSVEMVRKELESCSDFQIHQLCMDYGYIPSLAKLRLSPEQLYSSAKLELLAEKLPRLKAEGHRVLLFSQWTRLLDILQGFLTNLGMQYLRIDGGTEVKERQQIIDRYTNDENIFVMLASTRAGGLGINLTAADTVILHDLDFNPHNDRQAEDRCHRIGQTKTVNVIKLVAKDTVDEGILKLAERKLKLDEALLLTGKAGKQDGGEEDDDTMESMLAAALAAFHT